jgi:hypothetical protein
MPGPESKSRLTRTSGGSYRIITSGRCGGFWVPLSQLPRVHHRGAGRLKQLSPGAAVHPPAPGTPACRRGAVGEAGGGAGAGWAAATYFLLEWASAATLIAVACLFGLGTVAFSLDTLVDRAASELRDTLACRQSSCCWSSTAGPPLRVARWSLGSRRGPAGGRDLVSRPSSAARRSSITRPQHAR